MAVLAIPAAGALLGGALFSWSTTAMSVGWLLGSWLYGATSKATTPGINPQAMPNLNQSLRGSPVFITFGTNRISAQIVWTKNWKATRQKSSGKGGGKGGGSGGGGAMKGGGSAAQSYTYSWDMIFEFGMGDVPSYLKRGWIGGDALDLHTMQALLAGHPVAQNAVQGNFDLAANYGSANKPKAKLDFTEAFYAPGFPTGDPDLETWSYLQSQEGVAVSWPYVMWLGLKTLQLGQSALVPQLSFEIGPIAADVNFNPDFRSQQIVGTDLTNANDFWCGTNYVIANNKHWIANYLIDGAGTYAFGLIAIEDGTKVRLTEATFNADSPIGSSWDGRLAFGIPGTPYIYVYMTDNGTVSNYIMIYKLNDDQTFSFIGSGQSKWASQAYVTMDIAGVGVVDGNVYVAGVAGIALSTSKLSVIWELGALGVAPGDGGVAAGYWDNNIIRDQTSALGDFFYAAVNAGGSYIMQPSATFVDDGAGGYRVLTYLSKELINTIPAGAYGTPASIATNGAAYPNGYTSDEAGAVVFGSFDDVGLHVDGSSGADLKGDYVSPTYQSVDGVSYLIWSRHYKDAVDVAAFGNMVHLRIYTWDGSNQTAVIDEITPLYDDADAGFDNSGGTSYPRGSQFYIDADGTIWQTTFYQGIQSPITSRYISGTVGLLQAAVTDVTPPYIIYRILNSDVFGFNIPASRIDQASYADAVAYCEAQDILISVTYTTSDNVLQVIDELCSLYGGFLVDDAGTIKFGVVRSTDAPDAVVVDNSRLLSPGKGQAPVTVQKGAIQDGYNKVKFNYIDRQIDYKQNQIEISDEVDIDINGPRVKEFPATYVMAGSLAQMEAERALWTNLYGRDIFTFKLGAKDCHRQPGDVITLVDSFHPLLRGGVKARIMKWKESKRLEFDVQAVQVTEYQLTANHGFTEATSGDPGSNLVQPANPPLAQRAYEVPKEFQGAQAQVYFGYNQANIVMGAQLYLSFDAGASFVLTSDVQPYIISGCLAHPLQDRPSGYCEDLVDFYLMPSSNGFDPVNSPTWAQTHDLDDVSQGTRAAGGGVLIVGSEALAIQDLTLLGQNHYRARRVFRGWGGTPISQHNSGEYWHYHQAGIFHFNINEDDIGTQLQYKIAPYNFAGAVADLSSLQVGCYQIKGEYWLPRYQPRTKTWVQSAISWPRSAEIGERVFLNTTSGGCDVTITWPAAAQNEGFGAGGYGAGGFGHFTSDILTPSYRVNVYSSNGFSVRSTVVNTGFFTYDLATNTTDFSGFAQNLWFKVTPFTVKGDGPWSDNRTLNLFW